MKTRLTILILPLLLYSCLGTKYLKKDETILYKQKIKTNNRITTEEITPLLLESPNNRLFGRIAHLVYLYKLGENNFDSAKVARKKERIEAKYDKKIAKARSESRTKSLKRKRLNKSENLNRKLREGNQFMRWGEQLVVFDSSTIEPTNLNIKNYLFSKGYFNSQITPKIKHEEKKTSITYIIDTKTPYRIDSILYSVYDPKVDSLFRSELDDSYIKKQQYDQTNFANERDRINDQLSNTGYYNFKRQYVQFEVDSTSLNDHHLLVRQTIANPINSSKHQQFRLDSIIFNNQVTRKTGVLRRTTYRDSKTFNFTGNHKYPEKILNWRIFLDKDSLYSKKNTLETQRQLSYLDIFKFVNINYDSSGGTFVANIFTSPLKKFETSTEIGLSVLDQEQALPGPFFNVNAKSRNTFGGLEILQFSANTSIQGITSVSESENIYSRFQYGGELSVTFPQFLFPLKSQARDWFGQFNPRTRFATGINFEDRRDEYERTIFNGSMSYIWQVEDRALFTLKPFDLSYIFSENTDAFEETLSELEEQGNRSLSSAFESSIVGFSSISARFNKNGYGLGTNTSSLILAYVETGGNYLRIFGKKPFGININGLETYNYSKAGIDLRRVDILTRKSSFAYRFNLGVAFPYPTDEEGESPALPYEKYFFAGGSNSIRAWQPRRLGPGSFAQYDSDPSDAEIIINDDIERPGDIIIESTIEYRHDLVGFIDYALFIDAGNSWLWNSSTVEKETDGFGEGTDDDGKFRLDTFAKEIAVGAGYGLRMDFSFLILRVDFAYKIINPAFPEGERFILGDYKINDLWDFNEKGAINIGIGYPF